MSGLFDELRDGLNGLLERVAGDEGGPMRSVTRADIERELKERAKLRGSMPAISSAIAKRASSSPEARASRKKMAQERTARVHGVRKQREQAEARARDAAFEEAKRRAYQEEPQRRAQYQSPPGAGPRRSRRQRAKEAVFGTDAAIAKHYKVLNLPYGASYDEVKKTFRSMMRKYHPDMHSGSPNKQKAASELSKQLTVAYNELSRHLKQDS